MLFNSWCRVPRARQRRSPGRMYTGASFCLRAVARTAASESLGTASGRRRLFRNEGPAHGRHLERRDDPRANRLSRGIDLRDLSQPSPSRSSAAQQSWHDIRARLNVPHTSSSGLPSGQFQPGIRRCRTRRRVYSEPTTSSVLARRTTESLLRALATLRGKSGMWPENDPNPMRPIYAVC